MWIFTRLQPNELVELVRIIDNSVVEHVRINLEENGNGTCTGIWTLKFTALNARGNDMVEAIPDRDPFFAKIISGLGHFLRTGRLMRISGGEQ